MKKILTKDKPTKVSCIFLVAIVLCCILYVNIGSSYAKDKMWQYLEEKSIQKQIYTV